MLTEIRDRSSGWFAWIIALIIIVPMAFWGVQEYASTDAVPTIVEIGDQKITQQQFQSQLNQEQQRMRQMMGEQSNYDYLNSDGFKNNVLQQLINRVIIQKLADENNYQVGDQQLAQLIKASDIFQADGQFDEEAYSRYVQQSFYSKTQFEDRLRDQNRLGQVTSGYDNSAIVFPEEVKILVEFQAQQRTFDLVSIKQSDFLETVSVSGSEKDDYYNDNQNQFLSNEQMSVSFLELKLSDLEREITIDEDELKAIYEQSKESFTSTERRATRHILLKIDDADEQVLDEANELIEQLNSGFDFAKLAEEHSQDTGSAKNGGDLGLIERGQMVPEFEAAAFALIEGVVSEPVKSQFGYHIIKVEKVELSKQQSFEEVRFDIEQEERARVSEEQLLTQLEQLKNLSYEQPDTLEVAAEELGLRIQQTKLFDRNQGEGVAAVQAVREAAFSELVLVDEINSEPIQIADGEYVVLRKLDHKPSATKEIKDVEVQITRLIKARKSSELVEKQGQEWLAKAEENWPVLSNDENVEVVTLTISLADNERKVPVEVIAKINELRLDNGQAVVSSVTSRNGDFHIVRLTNVDVGDIAKVSSQVKDSTRRVLRNRNGNSMMAAYLDTVLESVAPEIDDTLL